MPNLTETIVALTLAPDCARTQGELVAFLDGELLPAQAALVEAHLAVCPDCAAHRDELRATLECADAFTLDREVDVTAAILRRIAQEPKPATELSPVDAARARAKEEKMPFIDLNRNQPEPTALATVPVDIARRYRALPVRKDGQTLFVAMANPRDIEAVDAMRLASRCMVRPMLAESDQLNVAIETAYLLAPPSPPTEMGQLLAGMQAIQTELSALRGEVADLRRQLATARRRADLVVSRPAAPRLFPFAAPAGVAEREG